MRNNIAEKNRRSPRNREANLDSKKAPAQDAAPKKKITMGRLAVAGLVAAVLGHFALSKDPPEKPTATTPHAPNAAPETLQSLKQKRLSLMRAYVTQNPIPLPKVHHKKFEEADISEASKNALMPIEKEIEAALVEKPELNETLTQFAREKFPKPTHGSYQIDLTRSGAATQRLSEANKMLNKAGIVTQKRRVAGGPDIALTANQYADVIIRFINRRLIQEKRIIIFNEGLSAVAEIEPHQTSTIQHETDDHTFVALKFTDPKLHEGYDARFLPESGTLVIDPDACSFPAREPQLRQHGAVVPWLNTLIADIKAQGLDQCLPALIHESEHGDTLVQYGQFEDPDIRLRIEQVFSVEELAFFKTNGETKSPIDDLDYKQLDELAAYGYTIMKLAETSETAPLFDIYTLLINYKESYAYLLAHLVMHPLLFGENKDRSDDRATGPQAVAKLGNLHLTRDEMKLIGQTMYTLGRKGIERMSRK